MCVHVRVRACVYQGKNALNPPRSADANFSIIVPIPEYFFLYGLCVCACVCVRVCVHVYIQTHIKRIYLHIYVNMYVYTVHFMQP